MFGTLKRIFFGTAILSGIASLFITMGTLNNRVPGGLTLANKPWSIAVGVFAFSLIVLILLRIFGPAFDDTKELH